MGAAYLLLQIVDRHLEPVEMLGQNLHGSLSDLRKRNNLFSQALG